MTETFIEQLGTDIEDAFFLIGVAILLIELTRNLFAGTLRWRGFADTQANISARGLCALEFRDYGHQRYRGHLRGGLLLLLGASSGA